MQLQVFKFEVKEEKHLNEIRSVEIDGEMWFVATDICRTLGYSNTSKAISDHCKEKGVTKRYPLQTAGGNQDVTLINESNIYRLILRSKLPAAEKFEDWLFGEVLPSIRKKGFYGKIDRTALPNFIERYKDNFHKLPHDHFSVISEMYARLYMELEKVGYKVPDRGEKGQQMMPDISVGRMFATYLKANHSHFFEKHGTYRHTFPDGREVDANMYHIDALPLFIRFINEQWIPECAAEYFKKRDPVALDFLPKLLARGKSK